MRWLKNHISLIIPLFAILFAIEFYLIVDRFIVDYEKRLSNDYSIILVSKKSLSLNKVKRVEPHIISLKEIDSKRIIDRLKKNNISINYKELQSFLPKFYKVYLDIFPSVNTLQELKKRLLAIDGVTRVETFMKSHEKIYRFLLFVKQISKLFLLIIFVTSVMLVFKQIEVWNLEHRERMYIMALFGAPLWMRNAILVKLSFIDALISVVLVYLFYVYVLSSDTISKLLGIEAFDLDAHRLLYDMLWLFLIGVGISLFSIIIISSRRQNEI